MEIVTLAAPLARRASKPCAEQLVLRSNWTPRMRRQHPRLRQNLL